MRSYHSRKTILRLRSDKRQSGSVVITMNAYQQSFVFCAGNPILDIVCNDVRSETLAKFGVRLGEGILAKEKHFPFFDELKKEYSCKFLPGGCAQNTSRIIQALYKKRGSVIYTGCVGEDNNGRLMQDLMEKEGVITRYSVSKSPTGRCAVLVQNRERAICTQLGAANDYSFSYFNSHWDEFKNVKAMYTAGFFLTVCKEVMHKMATWCVENNKIYCFNLSAFFLIDDFKEDMKLLLRKSSIIFGNHEEFEHFSKVHNFNSCSITDIAKKILVLMEGQHEDSTKDTRRFKYVCITRGSGSVVVATKGLGSAAIVHLIPVSQVPADKIVDLNGAGDSFVGGFLYGILNNLTIKKSVAWGHYAASNVIQRSGFSFDFSDRPESL